MPDTSKLESRRTPQNNNAGHLTAKMPDTSKLESRRTPQNKNAGHLTAKMPDTSKLESRRTPPNKNAGHLIAQMPDTSQQKCRRAAAPRNKNAGHLTARMPTDTSNNKCLNTSRMESSSMPGQFKTRSPTDHNTSKLECQAPHSKNADGHLKPRNRTPHNKDAGRLKARMPTRISEQECCGSWCCGYGLKSPQDGPKRRQAGPKLAPRWPQDGSKMLEDDTKLATRRPRVTLRLHERGVGGMGVAFLNLLSRSTSNLSYCRPDLKKGLPVI